MSPLQRPATLKEFVIQSLLRWREPAATLVDHDDEDPTAQLERPDSADFSRDSYAFDLNVAR